MLRNYKTLQQRKRDQQILALDQQFRQGVRWVETTGCKHIGRHDKVRVHSWLRKIDIQVDNLLWKQNRNFYLRVLREMLSNKHIAEPFTKVPPQGSLPKLTVYDLPYPYNSKFFTENCKQESQKSSNNTSRCHAQRSSLSGRCTPSVRSSEGNKENLQINNQKQSQAKNQLSYSKYLSERLHDNFFKTKSNLKRIDCIQQDIDKGKDSSTSDAARTARTPSAAHSREQAGFQSKRMYECCSALSSYSREKAELQQARSLSILKRTLKYLVKNNSLLQQQSEYKWVVSEILRLVEQKNVDVSDLSGVGKVSPTKLKFKRYSDQIREKFQQTGEETKEFMEYLCVLKKNTNNGARS